MQIDQDIVRQVARLKLSTPKVATGRHAGDRRSPYVGRGVEFADYRPYGPGDDLRLVDWNVYSRLQLVLVRLFHEDRNLSVNICVDASQSMAYGSPRKIDFAGNLAAALTLLGLLRRDNVTLGCSGGTGPAQLIRGQNQKLFPRALHFLELVEPKGVDGGIRALKSQVRGAKPDSLFYISDMLKEEKELDQIVRMMSALSRRPVLFHVLGEEELSPDLRHPKRIIDAESGEELRILGGRAAERAYNDALSAYLNDVKERCRALHIQYVEAFTNTDIGSLINDVLRRARLVQSASGASR